MKSHVCENLDVVNKIEVRSLGKLNSYHHTFTPVDEATHVGQLAAEDVSRNPSRRTYRCLGCDVRLHEGRVKSGFKPDKTSSRADSTRS